MFELFNNTKETDYLLRKSNKIFIKPHEVAKPEKSQ